VDPRGQVGQQPHDHGPAGETTSTGETGHARG
jgi:hypothetical protein